MGVYVLAKDPITFSDSPQKVARTKRIDRTVDEIETIDVTLGVKRGREIFTDSKDICLQNADVWFCVDIEYYNCQRHNTYYLTIITNGTEYYQTISSKSHNHEQIPLVSAVKEAIDKSIAEFVNKIT